jgi:hypothetical protein
MFNWYRQTKKKTTSQKEKVMSYNEYVVEFQTHDLDGDVTHFSFVEAKSPKDAEEKVTTNSNFDWIKIVNVKLCDEIYWRV